MQAHPRLQAPAAFVLPALLLLAVFVAYPVVSTIWLSFTDDLGQFVGTDNYAAIAASARSLRALRNTVYFVGVSVAAQLLLGTVAGIILNEKFHGQAIARALTLVPWVVPGIVGAMTWAWMFHTDYGVINAILLRLGVISTSVRWLSDPAIVLPSLIAVNVWKMFPFVAIMVLAGLQGIPKSLYEAAQIDGASFWHEVWYITLPQLRPILTSVTLLLVIAGVNSITIIYSMTRGGPADRSLITSIQIFVEAFQYFNFHTASALSLLFFVVSTMIIVIYITVDNRKRAAQE